MVSSPRGSRPLYTFQHRPRADARFSCGWRVAGRMRGACETPVMPLGLTLSPLFPRASPLADLGPSPRRVRASNPGVVQGNPIGTTLSSLWRTAFVLPVRCGRLPSDLFCSHGFTVLASPRKVAFPGLLHVKLPFRAQRTPPCSPPFRRPGASTLCDSGVVTRSLLRSPSCNRRLARASPPQL